ncbi:hypothetical protein NBRC116592_03670 [Colwellia sp. KU-HH00111]|uniref:Imm41 family immunity protein n=1 Tax=Colwellia sp. KU-HH00111 TaxID=3127652 RepID=UPI003109B474
MDKLLENFPHCDEYDENSFTGIWHEKSILDYVKYCEFEKCIFDLASTNDGAEVAREIAWPIMRIFSYIMMTIQSHYDSNDGFEILNLNQEDMYAFKNRFQEVLEGFFNGKMPDNDDFELINPLLEPSQ